MPRLNIYKDAPTKKIKVIQRYYIGGLIITLYKDGNIMLGYSTPAKNIPFRIYLKKGSKENDFFKKMVKAK